MKDTKSQRIITYNCSKVSAKTQTPLQYSTRAGLDTRASPPDDLLGEAVVDGVDVLSQLGAGLGLNLLNLPQTAGGDKLTPGLRVVGQYLARGGGVSGWERRAARVSYRGQTNNGPIMQVENILTSSRKGPRPEKPW